MAAANCSCVVLESRGYRLLMQSVTMDLCMLGHVQICNELVLAEGTQTHNYSQLPCWYGLSEVCWWRWCMVVECKNSVQAKW
jgi:hypothetical protein